MNVSEAAEGFESQLHPQAKTPVVTVHWKPRMYGDRDSNMRGAKRKPSLDLAAKQNRIFHHPPILGSALSDAR